MFDHLFLKLILALSRWIARRIENGSPVAASLGCVTGAVAGFGLGWIQRSSPAGVYAAVILGLLGGLVGALVGAGVRVGVEPTPAHGRKGFVPLPKGNTGPIRVTNLNVALAPVLVLAMCVTVMVWGARCWVQPPSHAADDFGFLVVVAAFPAALIGIFAVRQSVRRVMWLDIGSNVRVRRLLSHRSYEIEAIQAWRLGPESGIATTDASKLPSVFMVVFEDELMFEAKVSPALAERLADELTARAPRAGMAQICNGRWVA